ncbi:MAG: hypothetical protein V4602_19360 [Pseudomonadota bacterium]
MRRLIFAAAALAALTGAVSLGGSRAEAMSLPGVVAGATQQTEQVRLVCSMRRSGHRMVRVCRDVRPHYHRSHRHHAPRHRHGHGHGHRY